MRPRVQQAAAVIGLVAGLVAPPGLAGATHAQSTGSVDIHEALAGSSGVQSTMTIVHPAGTGAFPVNYVRIVAPVLAAEPEESLLAITGMQGPPSWAGRLVDDRTVEFTGGELPAGQAGIFRIVGRLGRTSRDACGQWSVAVSADQGQSIFDAKPAAVGALDICARVLKVDGMTLVAPAGTTDGSVTAGQSNVCARARIVSAATSSLSVAPLLQGSQVTVTSYRAAGSPPCTGPPLIEGRTTVPPGATVDVDIDLTFGPGASTPVYTLVETQAQAPGVAAIKVTTILSIQPRPLLLPITGSLSPSVVPPGASGVSFRVAISKSPTASPGLDLDLDATTFVFAGCPPRQLSSASNLPPGGGTHVLQFAPCDVSQMADGRYGVSIPYRFVDANGAPKAGSIGLADKVEVDGADPVAAIDIVVPQNVCCAPPERAALPGGVPLRVQGAASDPSPDTKALEPCVGCTPTTVIHQFSDIGCADDVGAPVAMPVTNSAGALSGETPLNWAAVTRSTRVQLTLSDEAGNAVGAESACVEVDQVPPRILRAVTQRDPGSGEARRLLVTFSECVAGKTGVLDWDPLPVDARALPCGSGSVRGVELTYLTEFPEDGTHGPVRYASVPLALLSERFADRVGLEMDDHVAEVMDGIPPGEPVIESVDGGQQGADGFEFSTQYPSVVVDGQGAVKSGYRVELYEETDGAAGLQVNGDRRICSDIAQGSSITLPCDFSGPDRTALVYAVSFDTGENPSPTSTTTFTLRG